MIGPICQATTRINPSIFAGGKAGTVGIPKPLLIGLTPDTKTLLNSLPQTTGMLSPFDRMPTASREQVVNLAGQAYAASGNPFWARKRIQEEDNVPNWAIAV